MKSSIRKKNTLFPLIAGFILNIVIVAALFYYSCTLIYGNFSMDQLVKGSLGGLEPLDGISSQMAFSLFISFVIYSIASVIISFMAMVKKEPQYFTFLCIFDFLLGAFKLVYDFFAIQAYDTAVQQVLLYVLISSATFIISSAIFETTIRKHYRPKICLIFDLLVFVPVLLPTIISIIEEDFMHKTTDFTINMGLHGTLSLLTTIAWIAVPNLILLYCGQFSASQGYTKDQSDRRFSIAQPLKESFSKDEEEKKNKVLYQTHEMPVISDPNAIQDFIKEESSVSEEGVKDTPTTSTNPSLGSRDETLAMFSRSKALFTTTELSLQDIREEETRELEDEKAAPSESSIEESN